jgi:hypothetical protein
LLSLRFTGRFTAARVVPTQISTWRVRDLAVFRDFGSVLELFCVIRLREILTNFTGAEATVTPRYSPRAWRALRGRLLPAGTRCALRLPGCAGVANSLDHIVEPSRGGAFFDVGNLRPACMKCNLARRNMRRAQLAREHLDEREGQRDTKYPGPSREW